MILLNEISSTTTTFWDVFWSIIFLDGNYYFIIGYIYIFFINPDKYLKGSNDWFGGDLD